MNVYKRYGLIIKVSLTMINNNLSNLENCCYKWTSMLPKGSG